jgi:hypothetical protein
MRVPGMPSGPAPKTTHGRFKGQDKVFVGVETLMQITYGVDPRRMTSKANLNRHMRDVNKRVLLHWHQHMRPVHFTTPGFTKYKMQRRTDSTVKIKKEVYHHNLPLVQKGLAKSLTGNVKFVRATPTRGRLMMHGPWYLAHRTKRKRGGLSPDLQHELTRVDLADARKLAWLGSRLLKEKLKQDKKRRLGAHVVKGKP